MASPDGQLRKNEPNLKLFMKTAMYIASAMPSTQSFSRSRLSSGPSAEKRTIGRELVALGSGATVPVDPAAVIASDESGSAALHFSKIGAGTDTATLGSAVAMVAVTFGPVVPWGWHGANGNGDGEEEEEERLHVW